MTNTNSLHDSYALLRGLTYSELRGVVAAVAGQWPELLEAALKDAELLRAGAASPANPYGPCDEDKHGRFDAASPGAVAADVPGPHLSESQGGSHDCIICRGPHRDGMLRTPYTAPCQWPAAHGTYPLGSAVCDVPGHHMGGAA